MAFYISLGKIWDRNLIQRGMYLLAVIWEHTFKELGLFPCRSPDLSCPSPSAKFMMNESLDMYGIILIFSVKL